MLKVILSLGGGTADRDRVMDALWSDADGDRARQAFATTLHRLRKLLGNPEALVLADNRLSLDRRLFRVDTWALDQAAQLWKTLKDFGPDRSQGTVDRILSLYRGPFLEGEFWDPSIIAARERTLDLFLETVLGQGQILERAGRLEQAGALYREALDREALWEPLGRRLAGCLNRLGRHDQALNLARRFQARFGASHGEVPAPGLETPDP
jgi:DNA-binding SARP family transcriptional activator